MKNQTLTIIRKGFFETKAKSENQCKEVGNKEYFYEIRIVTKCKLDENGFVFDQLMIDKAIKERFENFITSCELCCNEIEKLVSELLKEKKVEPIKTTISVKPIVDEAAFLLETNKPTVDEAAFLLETKYETELERKLKGKSVKFLYEIFEILTVKYMSDNIKNN